MPTEECIVMGLPIVRRAYEPPRVSHGGLSLRACVFRTSRPFRGSACDAD